jgi:Zn-dependent M28 family amino/carboxypeptidase
LDSQQIPFSFELIGIEAEIRVELKSNVRLSDNVVGVVPGRGLLADETVVIGAHYDHVGLGGYGSLAPGTIAIHNGADDNASGASALIACASLLKERLQAFDTHRRIVCIAFTAEERGLLGSAHYVKSPRFPISNTVAMVNLDMVGRLRDNELMVYGTGSGDSLDQVLEQANFKHQFNLFEVASGYGPSDHQSFYEAGVPVLFFFTGLHNDYHRPSDDFDKINFPGLFRITDMVCDVTSQLAVSSSKPKRFETDRGVTIRRQMTAYLGVTLSNRGDHVVLAGVSNGGPAAVGGLQVGDRIDRIGKSSIRTATDILELLRMCSPGETLDLLLIRSFASKTRRLKANLTKKIYWRSGKDGVFNLYAQRRR